MKVLAVPAILASVMLAGCGASNPGVTPGAVPGGQVSCLGRVVSSSRQVGGWSHTPNAVSGDLVEIQVTPDPNATPAISLGYPAPTTVKAVQVGAGSDQVQVGGANALTYVPGSAIVTLQTSAGAVQLPQNDGLYNQAVASALNLTGLRPQFTFRLQVQ